MKKIFWISIPAGLFFCSFCLARADSEYLKEAREYVASGEYKAAVIQLKNGLQQSPRDGEARFLLGTTYIRLADGESAIKELERAKELGISRERWLVPLARAYLLAGKPREMLEKIHPDFEVSQKIQAEIYALLSMAELSVQNLDQAEINLKKAIDLDDRSVEVLLAAARIAGTKRNFDEAEKYARQALEIDPNLADAWMILGEVERARQHNPSALENFNKALAINPGYLPAKLARASVLIGLKDFDRAEQDVDQVLKDAGDVPMALYLKGAIDFERKSYDAAAASLNKVVSAIPDHWPSVLLLGTIAFRDNKFETAYIHLSRFVNAEPDYMPAVKLLAGTSLKLRKFDDAIEIIESARAKVASDDPQLLALLGSAYAEKGDFDKATDLLAAAVEMTPDVSALRTQLALSYLGTGSFDQAVGELQTAIDLGNDLSQADVVLIVTLIRQKKFDEAIEAGLGFMDRLPDDPLPANLLGVAYSGKGDQDSARKYWRKALEITPGFIPAAKNLAKLEASHDNFAAAEGWFRAILEKHPGNIDALLGLLDLARKQGKSEEAKKWLDAAITEHPDDIRHRIVLADYFVARHDFPQAEKIIDDLKSSYPDDLRVSAKFGMIHLAAGDYQIAVDTFQQLANNHPGNSEVHYLLGQSWLKVNAPEKAKAEWREALKLKPAYTSALASLVQLESKQKQFDEALRLSREFQARFPKRIFGYQLEGDVLRDKGDQEEAFAIYRKAFAIEENASLVQRIFVTSRAIGKKREAYDIMLSWLEKNPQESGSRILLGMAYLEDGENAAAIKAYELVIETEAENVIVLNNLAWLYQISGDSRAMDLAEKALKSGANDPEVIDTVGWIFMQNGQVERALPLLEQAASQAPQIDAIQLHYAQALLKAGRKSEARAQLQKLLSGNRKFPERAEAEKLLKSI